MNFVFGELSTPPALGDFQTVVDGAGRELEVEFGDRLLLGQKDPFNSYVIIFSKFALDQNNTVLVSMDEQRFRLKDFCLIVKE